LDRLKVTGVGVILPPAAVVVVVEPVAGALGRRELAGGGFLGWTIRWPQTHQSSARSSSCSISNMASGCGGGD